MSIELRVFKISLRRNIIDDEVEAIALCSWKVFTIVSGESGPSNKTSFGCSILIIREVVGDKKSLLILRIFHSHRELNKLLPKVEFVRNANE